MKIRPEWSLRLGLGVMYLYSGFDLMKNPTGWHWALPYWLSQFIEKLVAIDNYLRFQGFVEILLALIFLAWFLRPKLVFWAALVSALELLGILVLAFAPFREANFLITFRDIGLLGASLALVAVMWRKFHTQRAEGML